MDEKDVSQTCRILVIGSQRVRLDKVIMLLGDISESTRHSVAIEYIACIAKFSSYNDATTGKSVRYLSSVECFPRNPVDGTLSTSPSSLLPFFDDVPLDDKKVRLFPSIAGAAIGSGIEGVDDSVRIESFLNTMASNLSEKSCIKVKTIVPNDGFRSMKDELAAYKALNPQDKEEADRLQTMGPFKMAKFVRTFAEELVSAAIQEHSPSTEDEKLEGDPSLAPQKADLESDAPSLVVPRVIDPNSDRFTCRICRTILFGTADLQYPAHEPSQHMFSYRKRNHGACITSPNAACQSYFLQDCLDWMGDDIQNGYPEGKFNCPSCQAKLGSWIWSGTQCSCGTWVVPAIQVPKGKVDVLPPSRPSEVIAVHAVEQEVGVLSAPSEVMQSLKIGS